MGENLDVINFSHSIWNNIDNNALFEDSLYLEPPRSNSPLSFEVAQQPFERLFGLSDRI